MALIGIIEANRMRQSADQRASNSAQIAGKLDQPNVTSYFTIYFLKHGLGRPRFSFPDTSRTTRSCNALLAAISPAKRPEVRLWEVQGRVGSLPPIMAEGIA